MIILKNKEEKNLWKEIANNAISIVETAKPTDANAKRVLSFMNFIADGAIISYRKRCEHDETS